MFIDIPFLIFLAIGFFNGFSNGLVHSVLSLLGIIFGIFGAIKFSHLMAAYLLPLNLGPQGLAIASFVAVFVLVVIAFSLVAWLLTKLLKVVQLNIFNKLAGGLIWAIIMTLIFSTMLWYINQTGFISDAMKSDSQSYFYLEPVAPIVIDAIGELIPFFKGVFESMEDLIQERSNTTTV